MDSVAARRLQTRTVVDVDASVAIKSPPTWRANQCASVSPTATETDGIGNAVKQLPLASSVVVAQEVTSQLTRAMTTEAATIPPNTVSPTATRGGIGEGQHLHGTDRQRRHSAVETELRGDSTIGRASPPLQAPGRSWARIPRPNAFTREDQGLVRADLIFAPTADPSAVHPKTRTEDTARVVIRGTVVVPNEPMEPLRAETEAHAARNGSSSGGPGDERLDAAMLPKAHAVAGRPPPAAPAAPAAVMRLRAMVR